jgi:D-serine deaminase-like pyridoxal phosphate-dependent protein
MTDLIGRDLDQLDTPALLVDLDRMERNIARMAAFAREHSVTLRPHAKSHKSAAIARRQIAAGAGGLTVAKLDEAEAFLEAGFTDLFIANQVIGEHKWERLAGLAQRGSVAVGIDNADAARGLGDVAKAQSVVVEVVIEIDTGLHRAGVLPGEPALRLAETISRLDGVRLRGIFTHAGHAYGAHSPDEVQRIGEQEGAAVVETAELLRQHGIACPVVSVGSTPTALISGAVPGVTEIRPGNYVFYDRMQIGLGSATPDVCALTVLATVTSRPATDRVIIDAGSKTFALDRGAHGIESVQGFGEDVMRGLVIDHLSEEHGIILRTHGQSDPSVGDRLRLLPNHACTTANLADRMFGVRGEHVEEVLPVIARGGGR